MQEIEHRSFDRCDEVGDGNDATPHQVPGEPLKVVEAFGAVWADRDLDAALAMITDDCVFDATGPAPDGTRCEGAAAIRGAWSPIFEDPNSGFEEEEVFEAGDRVVQRWRYSFEGGHIR